MKKAAQVRLIKKGKEKDLFIANIQFYVPWNLEKNGDAKGICFLIRILNLFILRILGNSFFQYYKIEFKVQFFKTFQVTFITSALDI